ncbi:MAG: DUF3783 domain-containing protein [Clostridiales bacterium]|nr:DUF3783 domain-containing protein [Clostridiales bacterium]
MAKVLLFQCRNEDKIRTVLASMKISAISVPENCFYLTLGEIERGIMLSAHSEQGASGDNLANATKEAERVPGESMVVMCGFTEKQMDRFLEKLRKSNIPVDFKAVLTATNRSWSVRRMYFEMAKERAMYLQMKKEKR